MSRPRWSAVVRSGRRQSAGGADPSSAANLRGTSAIDATERHSELNPRRPSDEVPYMAVKSIRKLAVACLALIALLLQTDPGAVARSRYRVSTVRVTKGLQLSRILDRRGPNRIRVLTVNPATPLTIDLALSNNAVPWVEKTSSMARQHGAIAATNGTYSLPWGRPIGLFAEDGRLKTSPLLGSQAFSMSHDEQAAFFSHTSLRMSARVLDTNAKWSIDDWNEPGRPGPYEITALTPAANGYLKPPVRACSARLYPAHKPMWTENGTGIATDYVVDAVRCSENRLWARGGTVVSTRRHGPVSSHIKALVRKQIIRLGWSVDWPGVLDMIAGSPTLLKDNAITATDDCPSYFCDRNPRTGVGMTPDGRLLLVTVDGRRPGYSVGMTPIQFAKLFRHLGATRALNLDGGGSTTMVVEGKIVNRPSDPGGERAVSSAVLILPGEDKEEREPLPYSGDAPLASPLLPAPLETAPVAAAKSPFAVLSVTDPASTGGLLDALSKGELGGKPTALPPALDRVVEKFRDSR
jgi:uncharacterized protein YigE (DUF2233 family)